MSNYKIVNGERILMTPEEEAEMFVTSSTSQQYIANRTNAPEATNREYVYPSISDQLDSLWHDINNGLFGESAKTGLFFTKINQVKINNPKE